MTASSSVCCNAVGEVSKVVACDHHQLAVSDCDRSGAWHGPAPACCRSKVGRRTTSQNNVHVSSISISSLTLSPAIPCSFQYSNEQSHSPPLGPRTYYRLQHSHQCQMRQPVPTRNFLRRAHAPRWEHFPLQTKCRWVSSRPSRTKAQTRRSFRPPQSRRVLRFTPRGQSNVTMVGSSPDDCTCPCNDDSSPQDLHCPSHLEARNRSLPAVPTRLIKPEFRAQLLISYGTAFASIKKNRRSSRMPEITRLSLRESFQEVKKNDCSPPCVPKYCRSLLCIVEGSLLSGCSCGNRLGTNEYFQKH
jgi:hypothetical protein